MTITLITPILPAGLSEKYLWGVGAIPTIPAGGGDGGAGGSGGNGGGVKSKRAPGTSVAEVRTSPSETSAA